MEAVALTVGAKSAIITSFDSTFRELSQQADQMMEQAFGVFLVEKGLITPEQFREARRARGMTRQATLSHVLLDLGFITEDALDLAAEAFRGLSESEDESLHRASAHRPIGPDIGHARAGCQPGDRLPPVYFHLRTRLEAVDLTDYPIDPAAIHVMPPHYAWRHYVLPLEMRGPVLVVATATPGDLLADGDVEAASGLLVRWVVAPLEQIEEQIFTHYGRPNPGPATPPNGP